MGETSTLLSLRGARLTGKIFIIESLLTIVVAVISYFLIHDYPDTAKFLKPHEREKWITRLKANGDATDIEPFSWANVRRSLSDISVWLYAGLFVGMSLPLYTLSLFLPTIIKNLGYTDAKAQLLTVPPYAFAFLTTITTAHLSYLANLRSVFILAGCGLAAIGYIVLLCDHSNGAQYAGVMLAAGGIYPACGMVLSWPANNVSGQTKRAVACGLQISIGILGGAVVGSQMYRPKQSPKYQLGHGMSLGYLAIASIVASIQYFLLRSRNAKKAALRAQQCDKDGNERQIVEEAGIGDGSIYWIYQL